MSGQLMDRKETQNGWSLRIGERISPMMSLGMPSSESCSNADYEIIAVRRLG